MSILAVSVIWACVQLQEDADRQARELVEKLKSDKVEERDEATLRLKELGRAATSALEAAAGEKDPELSGRAKWLLAVLQLRERLPERLRKAMPGIEDRLALSDPHVWTEEFLDACGKATKARNVKPAPIPLFTLNDCRMLFLPGIRGAKDSEKREAVFKIVVVEHLISFVPDLLQLIEDPDPDLRVRGVQALGTLRAQETAVCLRTSLKDPVAGVRVSAARALGEIGGKEVVPDLVALLEDSVGDVRTAAAFSLVVRGAREGIPGIIRLLRDPEASVRAAAAMDLGFFAAKAAADDLVRLLKDKDEHVRGCALEALGRLSVPEVAPDMAVLLRDPSKPVRKSCVIALSRLMGKGARPELEKALEDEAPEIQREAFQQLWALEARESIPAMRKLFSSSDVDVRRMVALHLCQWDVREAIPVLLATSTHFILANRIRRPDLWKRLEQGKYSGESVGPRNEIVEQTARESGWTVEWPVDGAGKTISWASEHCTVALAGKCALAVLEAAVKDSPYEFVLEDRRIRILSHGQALEYWKAWWAEQERTK